MKKACKTLIASAIIASMALSTTGCSKGAKECKEAGTEFIEAAFEREIEDMAELCEDEDDALAALAPYAADYDPVDAILERATVEAGKASVKKDEGTVVFTITIPDYDAALDEDPDDIDEFEDALDAAGTIEIEVTLEFVNKRDNWVIDNCEDFVEDFFEELYDIDFGFTSEYDGWIGSENWWGADGNVYSSGRSYLDLDLNIVSDHYYDDMEYYFQVFQDGSLLYTSRDYDDYGFLENYCYAEDCGLASFPSGSYTFVLYDSNGVEFYRSTCTVQ